MDVLDPCNLRKSGFSSKICTESYNFHILQAGLCLALIVVFLPETYVPHLLHKEAKKIRKETGDDRYHSASEHPDHKVTLKETLHDTIFKPFVSAKSV